MTLNRQDLTTGAIFIAIGAFFGVSTLVELPLGTLRRMDAGYFPAIVSGLLTLVGLVVILRGLRSAEIVAAGPVPWRAIAILLPMPVLFGATFRGLGLIPTVFVVAFIATFASRRANFRIALFLALGLTVLCTLVFYFALRLPHRLFGPWLEPLIGYVA
jgi:hypothetical protein